jgi:hypothetical protein
MKTGIWWVVELKECFDGVGRVGMLHERRLTKIAICPIQDKPSCKCICKPTYEFISQKILPLSFIRW